MSGYRIISLLLVIVVSPATCGVVAASSNSLLLGMVGGLVVLTIAGITYNQGKKD